MKSYQYAFSSDGTTVSRSRCESICLWDVMTGKKKAKLNGHRSSGCFSPDDSILASVSKDKSIHL